MPSPKAGAQTQHESKNPIVEKMVVEVLKQVERGGSLEKPLQARIRKAVTKELRTLEKRMRKGSETNRKAANRLRDENCYNASAYAKGSAFAFFQAAQIIGRVLSDRLRTRQGNEYAS